MFLARPVYMYIIKSGFVFQLLAHIIKKDRFKMAAGFRVIQVLYCQGGVYY